MSMAAQPPCILTRLTGGLGNQLFQYATGLALAERTGLPLLLDITGFETYKLHRYSLGAFDLRAPFADEKTIRHYRQEDGVLRRRLRSFGTLTGLRLGTYFSERGLGLNAALLRRRGPTYLDGYWQHEAYFSGHRGLLGERLAVTEAPSPTTADLLTRIQSLPGAVSLHVRRGDYVSDPATLAAHGLCDLAYYRRAAQAVKARVPHPHFFLFSDDPEWVRRSLDLDAPCTHVDHNDASRNYDDFRLMAACPHHIIANSSFSWWGAWIRQVPGQCIIAPARWFADEGREKQVRGIIPPGWTRL